MRQLFPTPLDPVDAAAVYGRMPPTAGRPGVRLNMISSVDGAATVDGLSGGLGGAADHALFSALRSLADVVLVAAGTVRAEGYGPARVPLAVVTRSCKLAWESPIFTEATARPIVITVVDAPAAERAHAAEVADVVLAGSGDVDFPRALDALAERGCGSVLVEGGPSLNAQLARDGILDEVCLTLAPQLVGGRSKRIIDGVGLAGPRRLELRTLCEQDGFLFLRFRTT